jgi:2-oxoglutarate ferredoxin oxidoreductase subunit gamma
VVLNPDILICMNLPSLDKFEDSLAEGGSLFIDSTLIERKAKYETNTYYVPATGMADGNGMTGLANMIIIGKVIKETGIVSRDAVKDAMKKVISERKKDMFDLNINAVNLGFTV